MIGQEKSWCDPSYFQYLMDVETPVIGGIRANVDEFKGDKL